MGLTKEQWHVKRVNEIIDYIIKHGSKHKDFYYWDTYPIVVKDICVLGMYVTPDKELNFGSIDTKNWNFNSSRNASKVERKYLEEILLDMKDADKKYKK